MTATLPLSPSALRSGSPRRAAWNWQDAAGWGAMAGLAVAWIATLLAAPIMPLQDVPDWIQQGWLLGRLLAEDPHAAIVALKPYPVPNTLVTLLAAALVPVFGADAAARLLAALALATVAAGCALLARAHRAGGWVATLLFAITGLSTPFLLGYLAFTLAVGLLAIALAADQRRQLHWSEVAAWSLLLFFAHAIAFAVFVLAVGWRHLVVLRRRATATALLPALALAGWYIAERLFADGEPLPAAAPSQDRLVMLWEQLRWKPFTLAAAGGWRELRVGGVPAIALDPLGTYWMIAFNLLAGAAVVILAARGLGGRVMRGEIMPRELPPLFVLLALFALAPPVDFFGMINVGERLWIAACLLLLPLARPRPALVAALVIASVPAHTLNLVATWRAGMPAALTAERGAPDMPWHPFILPLAGRIAIIERIDAGEVMAIEPGYATGILRNR